MFYYREVKQAPEAAQRIGVLLVNLGTPDSPTYFAVQRYLREFLSDRRVINTSRWIWWPLLYGLILPLRPFRTARNYRKIWTSQGSPLKAYSERLTAKVAVVLSRRRGDAVCVELGMTYGAPSLETAIESLAQRNATRLVVLPLYPQYSSSTTGSVFDRTTAVLRRRRRLPETRFVNDYYRDTAYINALSARIDNHWSANGGRTHLIFSYHGIPAAYVAAGDPYQSQAEETTRLLAAQLNLTSEQWSHCYQSRFGRVEWLQPYMEDKLKELIGRGVKKLTVVSPSFAVDCLETLEEIAIGYRDRFVELGGESLSLVPALNDDDSHAEALAGIIEPLLSGWT